MALRATLAFITAGWLLAVSSMSCEANVETRCVSGDESCREQEFVDPSTGAGLAGSGGGGGGGGGCFSDCDPAVGLGLTGELPCEIEPIMDNCRRCHTTPLSAGAPFPLDTYAETQILYFDQPIWHRMANAVETDFMPLDPPALSAGEKRELNDWICACAPPREAGVTCN